jgi:hypothetical protein
MHRETVGTDTPNSSAILGVEKSPFLTNSKTWEIRFSIDFERSYSIRAPIND